MVIVDSSVWVGYFNGQLTEKTNLLHSILGNQPIGVGDLIVSEVLQGFRNDKDFEKAKNYFARMSIFEMGGIEIAIRSAENYRSLRKKGITVRKTIDMIIGTFCIENDFVLLHDDKDFKQLEIHLDLQTL